MRARGRLGSSTQAELCRIVLNPERLAQLTPAQARLAGVFFSALAMKCTIRASFMGPGKPTRGPRGKKRRS